VNLCPCEKGGCGILLALARNQLLRLRWLLLAVGLGGVIGNPDRINEGHMGGLLARTQKNLKNLSPESRYLTPKIR